MAAGEGTIFAILGWLGLGLVLLGIAWGVSRFFARVITYAEKQCAEAYGERAATRETREGGSCGGQRPEQGMSLTHSTQRPSR